MQVSIPPKGLLPLVEEGSGFLFNEPFTEGRLWKLLPLWLQDGLIAAIFASIISGVPSTFYAILTHTDVWQATLAAGSIIAGTKASFTSLLISSFVVHGTLSIFWAILLSLTLPKRNIVFWGMVAGFMIATLDLLLIGQLFPAIQTLPFIPQLADHIVFGVVVGVVLYFRRG